MKNYIIDIMAASHKGLGIIGRRIITQEFQDKKEAMKFFV